jgi:hypothetical protein
MTVTLCIQLGKRSTENDQSRAAGRVGNDAISKAACSASLDDP